MPNKKSAMKRVRQNERRREHNRARRSAMRSSIKKVRLILDSENQELLAPSLVDAQSKLGKAAKTSLVKKRNASRRVSRLMKAAHKAQSASS
ncbi:30S ribosomal protein S20 [bacterium]|nr:30S ribosomal protein S20 [bacterium]